jgi:hypothetical protein
MVRPMQPRPATSTTFSCQLSNTLIAAPVDSFDACGLPPAWLNPVCCGVTRVGVRGALPLLCADEAPIPLYLTYRIR